MQGAARLGDIVSGHDCFPDSPIIEASPDISINGRPAARLKDAVAPHACTCPNSPHCIHSRAISEGSPTVFFNGKAAARTGDKAGCGGEIISGSNNVFIGNTPYRSPVHECARQAVLDRAPILGLSPAITPQPLPDVLNSISR